MRQRWAFLFLSFIWTLLLWNDHGLASPLGQKPGPLRTPALLQHDNRRPGRVVSGAAGAAGSGPKYVFRGVKGMPPADVKKRGGLLPNNVNPRSLSSDAYKLVHHLQDAKNVHGKDSAYVSTTSSFDVAAWFAQPGGYVYLIKTTPNMVPVASSVDAYPLPWEREYSALGGVVFEQIVECVRLPEAAHAQAPPKPNFKDKAEGDDVSRNVDQYRKLIQQGVLKPDNAELRYDSKRFDKMSASPGQPQLAGYAPSAVVWNRAPYNKLDRHKPTWEYAHEFMESIGAPKGWSDRFPLFQNPAHEASIKAGQKEKHKTH